MLSLTKRENDEIDKIISKMKIGEHIKKKGIIGLMESWQHFVKECEEGYSLTIYDYTNDLFGREILEDILDNLRDNNLIEKIKTELISPDNRLKDLLILKNNCLVAITKKINGKNREKYFWYWGVIKNPKGELIEDLQEEGLLSNHASSVQRAKE